MRLPKIDLEKDDLRPEPAAHGTGYKSDLNRRKAEKNNTVLNVADAEVMQEPVEEQTVVLEATHKEMDLAELAEFMTTPDVREVFYLWYNNNRPNINKLMEILHRTNPLNKFFEFTASYRKFLVGRATFGKYADYLDSQVREQMDAKSIAAKVEMLERHTSVAVRMQNVALEYLEEHREEITASAAVRLLVEGVRIERESRGIADAVDKYTKMDDNQLMDELSKLIQKSPLLDAE